MVTVMWNRDFRLAASFNHPRAFGKLVPNPVDLDIHHTSFGSLVLGQFHFRGRRICVAHGKKERRTLVHDCSGVARADYVGVGATGQDAL